jgi:peptide/nickel transport system substrate-binding protein
MNFFKQLRNRIASLSVLGRWIFSISLLCLVIGIIGSIMVLSNHFATIVPIQGGTYREGIIRSARFINPITATSDADRDLARLIYSGLARKDASGNVIPDLAESWVIAPTGTVYTVTLKPNIVFHDNKPLTSADVFFTISKIQDPYMKSPLKIMWDGVAVATPDERTVIFTLQKPYAGFLSQLSVGIVPKHIWEPIPDDEWQNSKYMTEPIGSGPYHVSSVHRSAIGVPTRYTLQAFRKFALGKPWMNTVILESFASKEDLLTAFSNGSIDGFAVTDPVDEDALGRNSATMTTTPSPRIFALFLNPPHNKIFAEPKVIQALRYGIDTRAIIDTVLKSDAFPLAGPLPQFTATQTTDREHALAAAQQLLDDAGWKRNSETGIREKTITTGSGKTQKTIKQPLVFSISTAHTDELEQTATLIKDQLAALGIETDIRVFEMGTLQEDVIRERSFDALLFGQVIRHDTDTYAFWHSSQKIDPGLNITSYTNSKVDAWLESALKEPDTAKRMTLYASISQELAKSAPVVFLYAPQVTYLTDRSIHTVTIPPIGSIDERFSLIHTWYINTDHVWNIFTH